MKLDKAGGLTAALELARAARAHGPRPDDRLHGELVAVDRAGAAPRRMSDFVDLDGPLWLREDRPGGVSEEGGFIHPPAAGFWGTP